MPEDDPPSDAGWPDAGRQPRYDGNGTRQQLLNISATQRDIKQDVGKLRDVFTKAMEGAAERGFAIRRIEDRLADLQARFLVVEANYVKAAEHEKELAPFRKWGSWIAMLVIGGVVTAVMALVLGKGGN